MPTEKTAVQCGDFGLSELTNDCGAWALREGNLRAHCYEIPSVQIGLLLYRKARGAAIVCALLLLAVPAFAEDYPIIGTHLPDHNAFYFSSLVVTTDADILAAGMVTSFGPGDDGPVNLGTTLRPWRNVYVQNRVSASSFQAGGLTGLTRTLHIGGFIIQVQGGLIVACFDQFGQACP